MNSKRNTVSTRNVPKTKYMEKQASLRWNVLRSVLALGVGFAVVPWLGSDVLAADTGKITRVNQPDQNLMQNNKADIYAKSAGNSVGLNRFQDFQVGKNDMANMYFKTAKDSPKNLDTLVNTVQNRIDINGTVNAIRDNKIGGNLYFLSPKGMVVGAGGVINAGSLTAITTKQKKRLLLFGKGPIRYRVRCRTLLMCMVLFIPLRASICGPLIFLLPRKPMPRRYRYCRAVWCLKLRSIRMGW